MEQIVKEFLFADNDATLIAHTEYVLQCVLLYFAEDSELFGEPKEDCGSPLSSSMRHLSRSLDKEVDNQPAKI